MHDSLVSYLGGYECLEASALENLACRVAHLDAKWKARDLSPVRDYQLCLPPQSITWLRLVAGTWLFVASSDNYVSKLTCLFFRHWDVHSVFRGHHQPLAEAYLPGQVKTGQLEIQESGIMLALGLGPDYVHSSPVHVITFQKGSDGHVFSELTRVDGSSHVLMLSGDFLGCALRAGTIVPHLVNWKENKIHLIPQSDVPGERNVPHLMAIRKNTLVLVRTESLQLYTLPSVVKDHLHLIKRADVPAIWEAVVSSSPAEPSILRLLIISAVGIEMCLIDVDILTEIDDEPICPRFTVATQPRYRHSYPAPWHRLCGGTRQWVWLSASEATKLDPPHFKTVRIPSQPLTEEAPPIAWSQDGPEQPALSMGTSSLRYR
ncbi:F-box domain-containing protein [Favolaschia claudopus]|uniref:F-box domain-containing protein n=1 Tax=Favolaschia claudopus TaxID=2862362 RepID=A0AAW0AXA3_9AGAR